MLLLFLMKMCGFLSQVNAAVYELFISSSDYNDEFQRREKKWIFIC